MARCRHTQLLMDAGLPKEHLDEAVSAGFDPASIWAFFQSILQTAKDNPQSVIAIKGILQAVALVVPNLAGIINFMIGLLPAS